MLSQNAGLRTDPLQAIPNRQRFACHHEPITLCPKQSGMPQKTSPTSQDDKALILFLTAMAETCL